MRSFAFFPSFGLWYLKIIRDKHEQIQYSLACPPNAILCVCLLYLCSFYLKFLILKSLLWNIEMLPRLDPNKNQLTRALRNSQRLNSQSGSHFSLSLPSLFHCKNNDSSNSKMVFALWHFKLGICPASALYLL